MGIETAYDVLGFTARTQQWIAGAYVYDSRGILHVFGSEFFYGSDQTAASYVVHGVGDDSVQEDD